MSFTVICCTNQNTNQTKLQIQVFMWWKDQSFYQKCSSLLVWFRFFPMKPSFVEWNTHSLLSTQSICKLHHFNVMKTWLHILKPPAFMCSPQSPATLWRAGQTVALWTCRLPEWPTTTSASGWSVWASEWLPLIYYQSFNLLFGSRTKCLVSLEAYSYSWGEKPSSLLTCQILTWC